MKKMLPVLLAVAGASAWEPQGAKKMLDGRGVLRPELAAALGAL